ncbi:c-type cytochrome [Thioclava indica]|uniref:Cytochrome c domain-containing protein n=1 Tax=Thioclava indica TaxID=1353528 RepID=A0A074JVX3_9RHOB|nr:c-type cytochrome [Thioclava indica]KEO60594.1 hypothetical protein DT23_03630 [Thioclava indica]
MTDKNKQDPRLPDETFEPYEEPRRIPMPVYWIAIALAIWGVVMLVQMSYSTKIGDKERASMSDQEVAATTPVKAEPKPDAGKALFADNCASCHGDAGEGVADAIPPLHASDVVKAGGASAITHIVMRGIGGPLIVDKANYDGEMPSFASVLDDKDIASIANFVASDLNGLKSTVTPAQVAEIRTASADLNPWDGGSGLAGLINGLPAQPASETAPAPSPDAAATAALAMHGTNEIWSCASCHGDKGEGTQTIPRLAGLAPAYLAKQLHDFKEGTRINDSMDYVVKSLSDKQIIELANYYGAMSSPSGARPSLEGDLARGEKIALEGDWTKNVPACFTCHGPSGIGVGDKFPGLAAQQPAYIAHQLAMWQGGSRHNSPLGLMAGIGKSLSDADRRAVADYLASLPPAAANAKLALAVSATTKETSNGQ